MDALARPEEELPDRIALELAAMCDLVVSGAARVASATFPRSGDADDIVTLARQITAGRRLVANVELAPLTVTVHITRNDEGAPTGASTR
jgi:hypothetical protein